NVYLVQLAADRFPTRYRSRGLELPVERGGGDLSESESHREEERRLCYVALTRARDELVTTYARDYGGVGVRERKPSIFLLEAFDLGKPMPSRQRRRILEELEEHRPGTGAGAGGVGGTDSAAEGTPGFVQGARTLPEPLQLSFRRLEDYETCPLKYRFLHELSVAPILTSDHRVNFGNAVHQAVAFALARRVEGGKPDVDEMLQVFGRTWRKEGYRSEDHERRRFEQGRDALTTFYEREVTSGANPNDIEKHFRVKLGDVVVTGSIDRIDEGPDGVTLIDYKTSEIDDQDQADKEANDSLQLLVYALAYQEMTGRVPDRLELRYVLTGLVGATTATEARLEKTRVRIQSIADSIRAGEFDARPSERTCSICACRPICKESAV
ncbi:MAG: PD-(D/E)XK nuclease family protein, partial [Candidatus Eiseniibacteriota bacterium]